jgi:hypothetical protein
VEVMEFLRNFLGDIPLVFSALFSANFAEKTAQKFHPFQFIVFPVQLGEMKWK